MVYSDKFLDLYEFNDVFELNGVNGKYVAFTDIYVERRTAKRGLNQNYSVAEQT